MKTALNSMLVTTALKSSQKMNAPMVLTTVTLMPHALTLSSALHVSATKASTVMELIVILFLPVARLSTWTVAIITTSFVNMLTTPQTATKVRFKVLSKNFDYFLRKIFETGKAYHCGGNPEVSSSGWINNVDGGLSMVFVSWFNSGTYILNTPQHVEGNSISNILYYGNQIRLVSKFFPRIIFRNFLSDKILKPAKVAIQQRNL